MSRPDRSRHSGKISFSLHSAQPRNSSLFLIELIIAIFFLSITCIVCVRLFLYAHDLSAQSTQLTHAVQEAQNAAENFIAEDGTLPTSHPLYCYDKDWNLIAMVDTTDDAKIPDGTAWQMQLTMSPDDLQESTIVCLHILVTSIGGKKVYETDIEQYVPGKNVPGTVQKSSAQQY